MKNRFVKKFVETCWVWIGLAIAIYAAMACEFDCMRWISLPINKQAVDGWNNIAKNLSYSYIAGVLFYVLSELLPFFLKQKFVVKKVNVSINACDKGISEFFRSFCGEDGNNVNDLFLQTTQDDYEESLSANVYEIQLHRMLAMRKVLVSIDDTMGLLMNNDIYIGVDRFEKVMSVVTSDTVNMLRATTQAQNNPTIDYGKLYALLQGLVHIRAVLKEIKIID